nr:unnamed protein product [Callosobruchus chinensis]
MSEKFSHVKETLERALTDKTKPWTPLLGQLEQNTGVNRLYIFLGSVGFIAFWLIWGFAAQLVCNCVGFLYPAYTSIKAIESRSPEDDTKWLTYWVVFAVFTIVEFFADIIVGWFPLYWLVKFIFLLWLMIPGSSNGSVILYNKIIRPYFLKHHTVIDNTINSIKENGNFVNGLARSPTSERLLWPASHNRTL